MDQKIEFISINVDGIERNWSITPDELIDKYKSSEYDLPSLEDTIVSCVFAGTILYFENFSQLLYTFTGEN